MQSLTQWKDSGERRPLLLTGARQVGKTFSALRFGQEHYANAVYVNLEASSQAARVFEADLEPERVVAELSGLTGQTIVPDHSLLILDEVQACERALTSLKYFSEHPRHYHVLATGSLLGVALRREHYSYPVGQVVPLTLRPLDFEEFLWANDQRGLADLIRQHAESGEPFSLHQRALDWYRLYVAVGGMPAAVAAWRETGDFNHVAAAQATLDSSFVADMAKYATPAETTRLLAAWRSLPAQLAKENTKFQYRTIRPNARSRDFATALDWLEAAGLTLPCPALTAARLPLVAHEEPESFKLYLVDTGLLAAKTALSPKVIVDAPSLLGGFAGGLTENYAAQALVAAGFDLHYWTSPGKAEVDFVVQTSGGAVVPIEVKAGDHVRSKSLARFAELYRPGPSVRLSARQFGLDKGIRSLPLYAAFCLGQVLA